MVTKTHACVKFSLHNDRNVRWPHDETDQMPTWSKSHLFKNRMTLTFARSGLDTKDFQSNSESSRRLIRGS